MNKTQIVVDSILAVAVIALFTLFFTRKPAEKAVASAENVVVADSNLPIAYLNLDSVLTQYQFAIEASDKLMTKQEDARLKLNTKARTLQSEAADFQRKLNMQLADTINNFLREFNADGRYQVIFANAGKDNILQAADGYDITAEVVEALNTRYNKKK